MACQRPVTDGPASAEPAFPNRDAFDASALIHLLHLRWSGASSTAPAGNSLEETGEVLGMS
jgi:hypothetical protein